VSQPPSDPIQNRHDFVFVFDVQDGNPNGDPDAGNLPRVDPETGHGLVSDVCIKRKIRNYVAFAKQLGPRFDIFVKEKAILNQLIEERYRALGLDPKEGKAKAEEVESPDAEADAGGEASAEKPKRAKKGGKQAKGEGGDGSAKAERIERVREAMCDTYFDVRTFGAVMSTGANAGQVRGPVQITFSRSVSPIVTLEHSITRMAVATEEEAAKQGGDNRTMGRKATVPYGLYRGHGFVSPALAARSPGRKVQGTGFDAADLALVWDAIEQMFEHDRSAARGLMSTRALVIFEHASALGTAQAHQLFEKVKIETSRAPARSFADHRVTVNGVELTGVRSHFKVVPGPTGGFGLERVA
jgi:CRISPR-associated protein Csd2